jgi:hypothetical protein
VVVAFIRWSWWPLLASLLIFAAVHTAIAASYAPVAAAPPRAAPKWLKISLWILFLYVAVSAAAFSLGLIRWPD